MNLNIFLKEQGISNAEFAEQIGVSEASVSRYAKGKRIPEQDIMPKIAAVTNNAVTANDFYGITEATASEGGMHDAR